MMNTFCNRWIRVDIVVNWFNCGPYLQLRRADVSTTTTPYLNVSTEHKPYNSELHVNDICRLTTANADNKTVNRVKYICYKLKKIKIKNESLTLVIRISCSTFMFLQRGPLSSLRSLGVPSTACTKFNTKYLFKCSWNKLFHIYFNLYYICLWLLNDLIGIQNLQPLIKMVDFIQALDFGPTGWRLFSPPSWLGKTSLTERR